MCSGQERTEVLSSRAAAFSIANLLNDDSKKLSETSELHTTRSPAFLAQEAPTKHYTRTSLHQQRNRFISQETQQTPKVLVHEKKVKQDGYTIRNILENAQAKITEQEELITACQRSNINTLERDNQLPQLSNCFDLVRNLDFMRSNLFFKDVPMMPHAQREIQVALQQSDLWWKFYSCGTEMVITRTGR
jgi:hypothetical protein